MLALLERKPWHEITLEQVMADAGLTRTAFYRHFPSREALLMALLEDVGIRLEELPSAWERDEGDPVDELRQAVDALTALYARVGRLLGAVAERIAADVAAGRSQVQDPLEVARALIWMNEGYLQDRFGREPRGDPERATAALADVWVAAVYGLRP